MEIDKLLEACHVWKVQFLAWLAKIELIAKNKWQVCPNKLYPKDCYPLPHIDQMVDSTSGSKLIYMLDVIKDITKFFLLKKTKKRLASLLPMILFVRILCHSN